MAPRHIAPAIARWGVIPAVGGFVALGAFFLSLPFRAENREDVWIAFLVAGLFAAFLFYVAYRGVVLIRFRNVRAELTDADLRVDHNGRRAYYCFHRLEVLDFSAMQIVEVREKLNGKKILAVDYYYPFGMELIRRLQEKLGEQVATGQPATTPRVGD